MLTTGAKVKVQIYRGIDHFALFTAEWKLWVRKLDGQIVELSCPEKMKTWKTFTAPEMEIDGWTIIASIPPPKNIVNWLPSSWLDFSPLQNRKITCDCPLTKILTRGCQNPNHM